MNRIAKQVRSVREAERTAEPAFAAGRCRTRAEYHAVRRVYRASTRYAGGYHAQQAQRALSVLPKEGPGAADYYLSVTARAIERRYALHMQRNGHAAYGTHID